MVLVFLRRRKRQCNAQWRSVERYEIIPQLRLRMGIHSGPVNQVRDVNDRSNLTGAGITAQRVMDCGNAGHICYQSAWPKTWRIIGNGSLCYMTSVK
jgi:hypothetical protein